MRNDFKLERYAHALMSFSAGRDIAVYKDTHWREWHNKDEPPPYKEFDDFHTIPISNTNNLLQPISLCI